MLVATLPICGMVNKLSRHIEKIEIFRLYYILFLEIVQVIEVIIMVTGLRSQLKGLGGFSKKSYHRLAQR
jgi:hypothetical protein